MFWYGDGELFIESHLSTHRNFFRRLWYGIRYAFGYKSTYGCWDEFIFTNEHLHKLTTYLNTLSDGKEEKQG